MSHLAPRQQLQGRTSMVCCCSTYAGQPMFTACSPSGSCVAVAGRAMVWACLPVPAEEQARELLRRREYSTAAELAEAGRARGEAWAEVASAQAALCMLHGEYGGQVAG